MIQTTIGQLLVNDALPPKYRDYSRVFDKKAAAQLLARVAKEDPDKYKDVVEELYRKGALAAHVTGGSFSISDLQPPPITRMKMQAFKERIRALINDRTLSPQQVEEKLKEVVPAAIPQFEDELFEEAKRNKNQLALQVLSGSRGSKADLRAMLIGSFSVADHKNRVVPLPILRGYAQGLTPEEYWAASYGSRKGLAATKLSVATAGFISKQLQQAAHRLVVTEDDCGTDAGIDVDPTDKDSVGALLARDVGQFTAGTPVSAEVMRAATGPILVRSPITCRARKGVCAKCAGIRERGTLPEIRSPPSNRNSV